MKRKRTLFLIGLLIGILVSPYFVEAQSANNKEKKEKGKKSVCRASKHNTLKIPKYAKKFGMYRQIFFDPRARLLSGGAYQLDTLICLSEDIKTGIIISVTGLREGDEFIAAAYTDDKYRRLIFQQSFYMNGMKSETNVIDSWFITHKRAELNEFLLQYFGIVPKKRKEFLRSFTTNTAEE